MTPSDLTLSLDAALTPLGFVRRGEGPWIAAWAYKTLNFNRGVVLAALPDGQDAVQFVRDNRQRFAKALGYIPFLYEMGMQIVLIGTPGPRALEEGVDKINNQLYLVQSIFVVDPATGTVSAARTWGQVFTGRFQDAIARALSTPATGAVPGVPRVAAEPGGRGAVPTPGWGRALPWLAGVVILLTLVRMFFG